MIITNFPHKFILTNTQVVNLRKAFAAKSSTDIKPSKSQLFKMMQLGAFLGRLLGPLLKNGLPLMKSVIQRLAKSVLVALSLTGAASVADAGMHKRSLDPSESTLHITTLIISNDEMKDIMKKVKSLEDSGLLLKGVSGTIQSEVKEKKQDFLVCY